MKQKKSTSTLSLEEDSLQPSVGAKARRILGFEDHQTLPRTDQNERPFRKAQQGFRWSRATSGFWIEIRIGKEKLANSPQAGSDTGPSFLQTNTREHSSDYDDNNHILTTGTPLPSLYRPLLNNDSNPQSLATLSVAADFPDAFLPADYFKEGLYCRTKRALGLKTGPIIALERSTRNSERAMTGEVDSLLDRTSSALRLFASKAREPTTSSITSSDLSIASPRSANRWQHLQSGVMSSAVSTSSSIRSFMRGRPPPPSPAPQEVYTGSDNNQYFSTDLTYPGGPTFLPSEARRIRTPPKGTPSVSVVALHRDIFLDSPVEDTKASYLESLKSTLPTPVRTDNLPTRISISPTQTSDGKQQMDATGVHRRVLEPEWYRIEWPVIDSYQGMTREEFVLSVPEHLPNSPVCPKHPKHKSGGMGVCVYHGRNQTWDPHVIEVETQTKP